MKLAVTSTVRNEAAQARIEALETGLAVLERTFLSRLRLGLATRRS